MHSTVLRIFSLGKGRISLCSCKRKKDTLFTVHTCTCTTDITVKLYTQCRCCCVSGTYLHFQGFNVVDVHMGISQSVHKITGLEEEKVRIKYRRKKVKYKRRKNLMRANGTCESIIFFSLNGDDVDVRKNKVSLS